MLCTAAYLWTTPGRILFPDDEIVFQTTRAMWERGSLAVEGIPKRTGELKGRPSGTFGWAPGTDGRRYGFFGHALSVVALPAYGLGKLAQRHAPDAWRHATRSDHYFLHRRSPGEDWPRLLVSLTNSVVTPIAAWLLVEWLLVLGLAWRPCVLTGLAYALGTTAWPYAGTFLSEPLSATVLLGAAVCVARYHRVRGHAGQPARRWLWAGALLVGLSAHVHVLNLIAIPGYLIYTFMPLRREGALVRERAAWSGALALGAATVAALGWSHYARFGDPWQTGRYDHYSHFIVPSAGLLAMLVGPGRSVVLYSPAAGVGLLGWRDALRRIPDAAWFAIVVVITRWVFVATRSDWWGGWAIGPRYLVPVVPLLLLPLPFVLARAWRRGRKAVLGVVVALGVGVLLQAHLAAHSIFEWMLGLTTTGTFHMSYLERSHWLPSASPIVGFFGLPPDMLSIGAVRLAQHGHPGLLGVLGGIAALGVWGAVTLARGLFGRPVSRASQDGAGDPRA